MTAIIDGVTVIGRPEEINRLIELRGKSSEERRSETPRFVQEMHSSEYLQRGKEVS